MNGSGWTPPPELEVTIPRVSAKKVSVAGAKGTNRSSANGRKIQVKIGANGSQS